MKPTVKVSALVLFTAVAVAGIRPWQAAAQVGHGVAGGIIGGVACDRDRVDPARRSSISRADDLLRGRHYVAIPSLFPPGIWSPDDFISWRVESGQRKPDRDDKFVACPGSRAMPH